MIPDRRLGFISSVRLMAERVESFDRYPFSLPAVSALREPLNLDPRVTFFVGENGSGKSTLMEAIAVAAGFNAEGGSKNFSFATRASESELHRAIRLVRAWNKPKTGFFFRAESYFNVGTKIEELDKGGGGPRIIDSFGGTSLHEQSHGESFLALVKHRFGPQGLYILDEPEAALSTRRQLVLLARMHELVNAGSQLIIATHSPILTAFPQAAIYELSSNGLRPARYEDTDQVQLTKRFLDDPNTFLEMLFAEAPRG